MRNLLWHVIVFPDTDSTKMPDDPILMKLATRIFTRLMVLVTLPCSTTTIAADSYVKQWNTAVIIGPIPHSNFKYYIEPQLRFIADPYIFNQAFLLGGLGYQFNEDLMAFAGAGWIFTKTPQDTNANEMRIWQQSNWRITNTDSFNLNSRTRLEERKNTDYSQYAYRLRQRIWLHVPFKRYPQYSFSCFDEVFFDFNHPAWVSPYFFAQNRAFIGIGDQLTNHVMLDAGYMNQYLHSTQNQLDHVLLMTFSIRD